MIEIYIIQLPVNWHPRILAFKCRDKAEEVCAYLNKERGYASSTRDNLEIGILNVFEDKEITILPD